MKVGLVLEGGGMRGLYTAGVLDAFCWYLRTRTDPILRREKIDSCGNLRYDF